jgi:hypothetical protein
MIVIVVIAITGIFSQSLISADKGKWIRKIIIVKEKSFSNSLSFLNDLKFSTKDAVIFNDITFKAGDSLDLYKLYESERILRERELLANVKMDLSQVGDDSVDVIISFADKWSTYVNFSYRRQGDYRNYGLTFKDLNLFGFGYNVSLSFAFLNFGKSREFIFFDKNLFGTRYEFKFQDKLYPEWGIKTIHLHRRFYSLESGHELSLYYQDFSGQKYIFQGESYKGMFLKNNLFEFLTSIGLSTEVSYLNSSEAISNRRALKVRYYFDKDRGEGYKRENEMFNLGVYTWALRYLRSRYFNFSIDYEDVQLGHFFGLSTGFDLRSDLWYSDLSFGFANLFGATNYLYMMGYLGRFYPRKEDMFRLEFVLTKIFLKKNNFTMRFQALKNPKDGEPILIDIKDIRGVGSERYWGRYKVIINAEGRFFDVLRFWKFSFGIDIFFEKALMKSSHINNLTDVGFGLMIENSLLAGMKIFRIEVAYNPIYRRFTPVISVGAFFSAFGDMDLPMPGPKRTYQY